MKTTPCVRQATFLEGLLLPNFRCSMLLQSWAVSHTLNIRDPTTRSGLDSLLIKIPFVP